MDNNKVAKINQSLIISVLQLIGSSKSSKVCTVLWQYKQALWLTKALSKACYGVILTIGSLSSIPLSSSISPNPASILSQKFTLQHRLLCNTSAWSLPQKSGLPQRSWQQIAPKLKISLWTPSRALAKSFIWRISGATQPGVPHLTKMYYSSSILVARPKSTILISKFSPTIMLSGLISLCTMPNFFRSRNPQRREVKIFLRCSVVIVLFFFMNVSRETPSMQSIARYKEFSVSQTPLNLAICQLFTALMMLISYSIALLPSPLKAFSFENTFTAVFSPFITSSARQTVAKLPCPSFLNGLKLAWKPLWVMQLSSASSHSDALGQKSLLSSIVLPSTKSLMPSGLSCTQMS